MAMNWDFINRKLKEFFENRKSQSIDKLFTVYPTNSKRPQIELETQNTQEESQPILTRPSTQVIKERKVLPKSFSQISHLFSPHGPARSQKSMQMRMIVTGTLKNESNAYNSVRTKDIVKVQQIVEKQPQSTSKSYQFQQKKNNIQNLLLEFDDQLDHQISPKYTQTNSLQTFVTQAKKINTLSMKAKIKTQSFLKLSTRNDQQTQIPSPAFDNFSQMDFKKNTDQRIGLDRFLTNKWLQFIVEFKTMRKSDQFEIYVEEFMKSEKAKQEIIRMKEKQKIREFYREEIKKPYFKPHRYLKEKDQYKNIASAESLQKTYDSQIFKMDKKMDEDELMEFHPDYYSYKIKKRRIIHKLRMLSKEAIKKRINIRDLLETYQSSPYQQKGAVTFLRYVKSGHTQAVIQLLQKDQKLISSFDELHQHPIHLAVQRRNIEMVKILLHFNGDINAEDIFQQKPLYFALTKNDLPMVKLLLSYGASCWDINQKDYFPVCRSDAAKNIIKLSHFMSIQAKSLGTSNQQLMFEQIQTFDDAQIELALTQFRK